MLINPKNYAVISIIIVFALLILSTLGTTEDDAVEERLSAFFNNPKAVINLAPIKDYSKAPAFDRLKNKFRQTVEKAHEFYALHWDKDFVEDEDPKAPRQPKPPREAIMEVSEQPIPTLLDKRGAFDNDLPERILLEDFVVLLEDMPMEGTSSLQMAWSNDYWPLTYGSLSVRYQISREYEDYKEAFNFYHQPFDFLSLFKVNKEKPFNFEQTHLWSPAEKYDLLVGDKNFTLTNALKQEAIASIRYEEEITNKQLLWLKQDDQDRLNIDKLDMEVALWQGKCHGWAGASTVVPRVVNAVEIKGVNDDIIKFEPDDIRGLVTLKWSQSPNPTLFTGGRCNKLLETEDEDKKIKTDKKTGAILDDECFDVNPFTFHTVIANQVGLRELSVVIDATLDQEVWNHPVRSYQSIFWSTETAKKADTLAAATTDYHRPDADPFHHIRESKWQEAHEKAQRWIDYKRKTGKEFRPTQTVGVVTKLTYVVETLPTHGTSHDDELTSAYYIYDLELAGETVEVNGEVLVQAGEVVGGEWYTNKHPDFMWAVAPTEDGQYGKAQNGIDVALEEYGYNIEKGIDPAEVASRINEINGLTLPNDNRTLVQISSKDEMAPLATIVDHLVSLGQ